MARLAAACGPNWRRRQRRPNGAVQRVLGPEPALSGQFFTPASLSRHPAIIRAPYCDVMPTARMVPRPPFVRRGTSMALEWLVWFMVAVVAAILAMFVGE